MKTYKVTVTFEIHDEEDEIGGFIAKDGQEQVELDMALGFTDPDFHNVTCKIKEKE